MARRYSASVDGDQPCDRRRRSAVTSIEHGDRFRCRDRIERRALWEPAEQLQHPRHVVSIGEAALTDGADVVEDAEQDVSAPDRLEEDVAPGTLAGHSSIERLDAGAVEDLASVERVAEGDT